MIFRRHRLGLIGRLVAILVATLIVEFAVSTLLYERATAFSVRDDEARRLAEHLVIARRLLEEAPLTERPRLSTELTTDRYVVQWTTTRPTLPSHDATPGDVQDQVLGWEPTLLDASVHVALVAPGDKSALAGAMRLRDGSWVSFRTLHPLRALGFPFDRVLSALMSSLVLVLLGGLLIRQTLQPIQTLTRAVERFGPGRPVPPVEERGTTEVRHLIEAFNALQARVHRLIEERTRALAAVGHDLRTPLARLRLRTDGLADPELRDEVEADVDQMEAMVTSLLAFLGGEDDPERPRRIDLGVLCASIADDATDRGHDVHYDGPAHLETILRPSGMRRALTNLVENGVRYGRHVWIRLQRENGAVLLLVEDDGPGIPDASLDLVLEPFVRLDEARRRDTSGFGLGLSIVAQAVKAEDGSFALANRPQGGLVATIRLAAPQQ